MPSQLRYAADPYQTLINRYSYTQYGRESYGFIQNWLANAVLRNTTGLWTSNIASLIVPMRTERIVFDEYEQVQTYIFPLLIILMYIIPIHRLVMRIVTERESSSREIMKVMGMSEASYWLSWFIYFMSIATIIAASATLITKYQILPHSNGFLIFAYFWLFGLSLFGYVVLMSSFFRSAMVASLVSNLLYFFTHLCDYAV